MTRVAEPEPRILCSLETSDVDPEPVGSGFILVRESESGIQEG